MAIITYPVNGEDFHAEDVETYMCTRTSGVYAGDMDYTVTCTGADNNVSVSDGLAWMRISRFGGKSVASKETTVLNAGLSDPTYPRIDAVVLQWSANKNGCELVIKKGKAQSNPQPPEVVRNPNTYELHLFHIKRRVGATTIAPSDLTDLREDEKFCGIMYNDVTLKGAIGFLTQKDKGAAGGVAPLGEDRKVPAFYIPNLNYIPSSEKGHADGVPELDRYKRILEDRLPATVKKVTSYTEFAISGGADATVNTYQTEYSDFGPFAFVMGHANITLRKTFSPGKPFLIFISDPKEESFSFDVTDPIGSISNSRVTANKDGSGAWHDVYFDYSFGRGASSLIRLSPITETLNSGTNLSIWFTMMICRLSK